MEHEVKGGNVTATVVRIGSVREHNGCDPNPLNERVRNVVATSAREHEMPHKRPIGLTGLMAICWSSRKSRCE